MKTLLPIFSAVLLCGVCHSRAQEITPVPPNATAAVQPQLRSDATAEGDRLMRAAIERLAQHQAIAAKVRQRIDLYDQQLLGSGTYLQQGNGAAQRIRLELRIQAGDQAFSLLNVCDGRYLWTFKELGGDMSLGRVELARVLIAREHSAKNLPPNVFAQGLNIGGLSRLLEDLGKCFQFATVQEGMVENQAMWIIEGRWKPAALAAMLPESAEDDRAAGAERAVNVDDLEPHVPDSVMVLLGQDDLLPYRIDFRRRQRSAGAHRMRSLVTIDFFDVEINALVNPQEFVYLPGKRQWSDQTDAYIKRLGLERD